jgi:hypothetical protein
VLKQVGDSVLLRGLEEATRTDVQRQTELVLMSIGKGIQRHTGAQNLTFLHQNPLLLFSAYHIRPTKSIKYPAAETAGL